MAGIGLYKGHCVNSNDKVKTVLSGIIKLLSDAVANQIAAGEVVQRPSSIVKELLENSIDAGATQIKLLIKDGGSTLVQVIDNGKGMSETDARLCWERHATSKIKRAEDLFSLNTYGFRGEAMASIAAVAQVEMKTRRQSDEVGTFIRIEASECLEQSICSAPIGTSIAVKNVFFNIPARRNFLKSISVETKHIFEEFQRQAMANPKIGFQLFNQNQEVFDFPIRSLKERIADVLGRKKIDAFIEVDEPTEIITIHGFIGTPELARKTRGDQFFFVNDRFIKSPYFHHAVNQAFEGVLESDHFPTYVLFFTIDPSKVDVNVHPTKTEVKFEDERHIYNILKAAVRKSLNSYILPQNNENIKNDSLGNWMKSDPFTTTPNWNDFKTQNPPSNSNNNYYNPFSEANNQNRYKSQDWEKILGPTEGINSRFDDTQNSRAYNAALINFSDTAAKPEIKGYFTISDTHLVCNINELLYLIDLRKAQQHLYFIQYSKQLENQKGQSQQLLFPRNIELPPSKLAILLELMEAFSHLGFDLGHFGGNAIIINGLPAQLPACDEQALIEKIIDDYEQTAGEVKLSKNQALALSMSRQSASKQNVAKNKEEFEFLINGLFQSEMPQYTFDGKQIYVTLGADSIFELFNQKKRL